MMPTTPPQPDEDAAALGVHMAQACAPAFVFCHQHMPADDRAAFICAFVACISGMAQQAIGHPATVDIFNHVAGLAPVGNAALLQ